MMTLGEVINLLKTLYQMIIEYLLPLFQQAIEKPEATPEETPEA